MSNTYNSKLAREARKLQKTPLWRQPFNLTAESHSEISDCKKRLKQLGMVGERFGNHRKMYAKIKVQERRADRRTFDIGIIYDTY